MTGVAESVAGLRCFVLSVAKLEKLETLRRAWPSEACRVSSASDRLRAPKRVSNFLSYNGFTAGERPAISFVERQPALNACDTYHLRRHRRRDRHFDLAIDFSSDLEDLRAH